MSETSLIDRIDTDELSEQLDPDLLEGLRSDDAPTGSGEDSLLVTAAGVVGAAVGRRIGERLGRELDAIREETDERGADGEAEAEESEDDEAEADESEGEEEAEESEGEEQVDESEGVEEEAGDEPGEATDGEEGPDADAEGDTERGDTDADTDDGSDLPTDLDDLREASYRDLQSLAMNHDIKANLSREELTEELAAALGIADSDDEDSEDDGEE